MAKTRTYKGTRLLYKDTTFGADRILWVDGRIFKSGECLVTVEDELLPSVNLDKYGLEKRYEWGNKTSFAYNLAESILSDYIQHLSNDFETPVNLPKELVVAFLEEIITPLNSDMWQISEFQIADFINTYLEADAEGYDDEVEVDEESVTLMEAFLETVED